MKSMIDLLQRKTGLLTFKNKGRVRGMLTLPLNFLSKNPEKYKIIYIDDLDMDLVNLKEMYGLKGFLSFPRNTETISDYIGEIEAKQANVVFWSSSNTSFFLSPNYSNGYFYARAHDMNWWWSFIDNAISPATYIDTKELYSDNFRVGFYARAEHLNHYYYKYIFEALVELKHKYIEVLITGTPSEFLRFKRKFFEKYPKSTIKFKHIPSGKQLLELLKESPDNEYWVTKLVKDSIPNLYFEMKLNSVNTRTFNYYEGLQIGVDEIDYFIERKTFQEDYNLLIENLDIVLDPDFRTKLSALQKEHINQYPIPNKESFNAAMDDTIALIEKEKHGSEENKN